MKGKIKWFNVQKGFGFVLGEDEKDYFLHVSQVPEEFTLREDDQVEFDVIQTDRGPQAQNLKKLDPQEN